MKRHDFFELTPQDRFNMCVAAKRRIRRYYDVTILSARGIDDKRIGLYELIYTNFGRVDYVVAFKCRSEPNMYMMMGGLPNSLIALLVESRAPTNPRNLHIH